MEKAGLNLSKLAHFRFTTGMTESIRGIIDRITQSAGEVAMYAMAHENDMAPTAPDVVFHHAATAR
jgi:hypothetical protein